MKMEKVKTNRFKMNIRLFEEILKELRLSNRFDKNDLVYVCYGAIKKSYVELKGLTNNEAVMIEIKIPKKTFTEYKYKSPVRFVFDEFEILEKKLKFFKKTKDLIIHLNQGEVIICDDKGNVCFSIPLSTNKFENLKSLSYANATKVKFNLQAFKTFVSCIKKRDKENYITIEANSDDRKLIITHKGNKLIQNIYKIEGYYKNHFGYPLFDAVQVLKVEECQLFLKPEYPIGIEADFGTHTIHIDVAPLYMDD